MIECMDGGGTNEWTGWMNDAPRYQRVLPLDPSFSRWNSLPYDQSLTSSEVKNPCPFLPFCKLALQREVLKLGSNRRAAVHSSPVIAEQHVPARNLF
jgi:hypothetical protein